MTLFQFDSNEIDTPSILVPPPPSQVQLFTYDASTKTLTLNAGAAGRGGGLDNNGDDAEDFTVIHVYHARFLGLPAAPLLVRSS